MLQIIYFGFGDQLVYREGKRETSIRAVSGGGRGQKRDGKLQIYGKDGSLRLSQRDWRVQSVGNADEAGSTRGGPIPPGVYDVGTRPKKAHTKFGKDCAPIYLTALSFNLASNTGAVRGTERAGRFFFHGRGRLGSDGCIVPVNGNDELLPLLDALDRQGGGRLRVVQTVEELKRIGEDDVKRLDAADQYMRVT